MKLTLNIETPAWDDDPVLVARRIAPSLEHACVRHGLRLKSWSLSDESDLEGSGQARRSDPNTAKAAGEIRVNRGTMRWRVLEALQSAQDGLTSHELELETGIPYASLTPRIGELKRGGFIEATDRTRPSQYGVEQEVLQATHKDAPSYADVDIEPAELWDT